LFAEDSSCLHPVIFLIEAMLFRDLPETNALLVDTMLGYYIWMAINERRLQKKPYSAVTVTIENLTGESYEEDDLSGIPDLVEVIKLQSSGPVEAARAIRKKLKYGSVHRQLRALTILDGLIQNAGPRFQRAFADEPLLERLRVCGTSDLSDPDVKKKCTVLFRSWANQYKNTPGLERIAKLYKVPQLTLRVK
jgi:hypothetical protein